MPVGGTWTTPEGVRITVLGQTSDSAEVRVDFGAGASTPPDAPAPVHAAAGENSAAVDWTRPADNGALITKYVVTASPGDVSRTVRTLGGTTTEATLPNLPGGTTYTIAVKAYNEKGASVAATDTVTPINLGPAATISSPTGPQSGTVTVSGTATPNATSNAAIATVDLLVDGSSEDTDSASPWSFSLDTRYLDDGDHTLRLRATDVNGKTGLSPVRTLTVDNPTASITVTSPGAGAVLSTTRPTITFSASPSPSWFEGFEVRLGQESVGYAEAGQPLVADLSGVGNGTYALRVVGYVGWDEVLVASGLGDGEPAGAFGLLRHPPERRKHRQRGQRAGRLHADADGLALVVGRARGGGRGHGGLHHPRSGAVLGHHRAPRRHPPDPPERLRRHHQLELGLADRHRRQRLTPRRRAAPRPISRTRAISRGRSPPR